MKQFGISKKKWRKELEKVRSGYYDTKLICSYCGREYNVNQYHRCE